MAGLTASGIRSGFIALDVADEGSCKALIDETVARFGRLDILVNNAGIAIDRTVARMTDEDWNRVIAVNLSGAFFMAQAAAEQSVSISASFTCPIASGHSRAGRPPPSSARRCGSPSWRYRSIASAR